jgi:hypothetical protein
MAPRIYWENSKEPWFIQAENTAYSGKVAIMRTQVSGNAGRPMRLKFTVAQASDINTWLALVTSSQPFTAATIKTGLPGTVVFSIRNPLIYHNMILRDGNYDITQTIFTHGHSDYKEGFDNWEGSMNLIMVG